MPISESYQPESIENKYQSHWEENKTFCVTEDPDKTKFYCLSMFPYPSGQLHMGHVRNYTLGDVVSRYQIMLGKNVLQPMGWDAFGLPAENAALKHKTAPSKWTYENIDYMRGQLKQLGFAYDWSRELATCKPDYYRWEQWLFIKMHEKGLIYKKNAMVNWDPVDQTVLANEQVVDGKGWRSGAVVERKEIAQWFLKITDYADELLDSLDNLAGWPEQVRTMQRNWIGRSEGIEIEFAVENNESLRVYTTRPDTIYGVSYMAIAAQHPLAKKAAENNPAIQDFINQTANIKVAEAEMATMEKKGIETGFFAIHPLTQQKLPIWIANFVLMDYGTGAVMSVPAHDERDHEFAEKYNLPIQTVIDENNIVINSDSYNGQDNITAANNIMDKLESLDIAQRQKQYRLRDWGVSRQRYWGTPIPMINCPDCGTVPVPENQLPVVLPENIELKDPGSPLNKIKDFFETICPKCDKSATRETDTFDTFMESSWYYTRYTNPHQDKAILDKSVDYWAPVDQYIGGVEHAVMHLLYVRFIHKVLRDLGLVNSDEPIKKLLTQGMVLKDGAKMSKSKGNTVDPQGLIDKYGADTVRLFIIFASPPEQSLEWSDSGVEGCHKFLKRLWQICFKYQDKFNQDKITITSSDLKNTRKEIHRILQKANFDIDRQQFNTIVSAAMKLLNTINTIEPNKEGLSIIQEGLSIIIRLLNPITPHLCQYLWENLNLGLDNMVWPEVDKSALESDTVNYVIQINGKKRGELTIPNNLDKKSIEKLVLNNNTVQNYLDNKNPKKIIIVPNRLINVVI